MVAPLQRAAKRTPGPAVPGRPGRARSPIHGSRFLLFGTLGPTGSQGFVIYSSLALSGKG